MIGFYHYHGGGPTRQGDPKQTLHQSPSSGALDWNRLSAFPFHSPSKTRSWSVNCISQVRLNLTWAHRLPAVHTTVLNFRTKLNFYTKLCLFLGWGCWQSSSGCTPDRQLGIYHSYCVESLVTLHFCLCIKGLSTFTSNSCWGVHCKNVEAYTYMKITAKWGLS